MCEEGWISEARQHLQCSVGLLMRAMLRMMELRGLTNFGKREQEEESGGGIWGLCYSLFDLGIKKKKKWPRDVVKMRELLLGSLTLLFHRTRVVQEFLMHSQVKAADIFLPPLACLQIITGSS